MEKINLGGEPINRCDIFRFEDVVQVKIWMTEDEYFNAFQNGGPSYERKVLMNLRDKLFSSSSLEVVMFHDQDDFKEFKSKYPQIEDGWFNSTFIISYNKDEDKIINDIKDQFNAKFNNKPQNKMTEEFSKIMNFSNYYSAGSMEYGVDGPEIEDNKLYISVYHYLQYLGENPRDYDTFGLGNYLTGMSLNYKSCKYESQSFSINKFDLDLLKKEERQFTRYKR